MSWGFERGYGLSRRGRRLETLRDHHRPRARLNLLLRGHSHDFDGALTHNTRGVQVQRRWPVRRPREKKGVDLAPGSGLLGGKMAVGVPSRQHTVYDQRN